MYTPRVTGALTLALTLSACTAGEGTAPTLRAVSDPSYGKTTVTDPTATFKFPLADAGLSLKSDRLYSDGTNSVYADGVCGTSSKIFATTAYSNSGDATLQTTAPKSNSCGRVMTVSYSDGVSEVIAIFMNAHQIENTTYSIPIGSTVTRHFGLSSKRCNFVTWGMRPDGAGVGSDSVLVTRVDSSTWHVKNQPNGLDLAYCGTTGLLYHMTVDFTIVSSRALP